jgi:hypothetical protein
MLLSVREVEKSQRMNTQFTLKTLSEDDQAGCELLKSGIVNVYEMRRTVKDGVIKYPCISLTSEWNKTQPD